MCRFPEHALNVADKAVDVTFACCFVNYVFVVVITQATTKLLVVHFRLVLALAPPLCHLQVRGNKVSVLTQPVRLV